MGNPVINKDITATNWSLKKGVGFSANKKYLYLLPTKSINIEKSNQIGHLRISLEVAQHKIREVGRFHYVFVLGSPILFSTKLAIIQPSQYPPSFSTIKKCKTTTEMGKNKNFIISFYKIF